jgi:hypothetical protein
MLGCGRPPNSRCGGEASANPGDLRRHHVHDHAGGQRCEPAGDIEPDPADRDHPLADQRAGRQLDLDGRRAELRAADSASTFDSGLEGGAELRVQPFGRRRQLRRRHPERLRHDLVEGQRILSERLNPALGHRRADGPDHLDRGRDVELGPRQHGGIVQGLAGGQPAAEIDQAKHQAILRMRRRRHRPVRRMNIPAQVGQPSIRSPTAKELDMPRITPSLWFDDNAEEAIELCTSLVPHSSIGEVYDPA